MIVNCVRQTFIVQATRCTRHVCVMVFLQHLKYFIFCTFVGGRSAGMFMDMDSHALIAYLSNKGLQEFNTSLSHVIIHLRCLSNEPFKFFTD
jgi:hypothetical protein